METSEALARIRVAVGAFAVLKGFSFLLADLPVDSLSSPGMMGWWLLSAMVLFGAWARFAAVLMAGWAFQMAFGSVFSSHLYLLSIVCVLLALSDCERHLALRPRGAGEVADWPLFLMRCQLSIVYGFAALAKINTDWLSGVVVGEISDQAYLVSLPDLVHAPLAWSVVAVEGAAAALPWLARTRILAGALIVALHAGMFIMAGERMPLLELAIFAGLMGALYSSFFARR